MLAHLGEAAKRRPLTAFGRAPTLHPSINGREEGWIMTVITHAALRGAAR